MQTNEQRRLRRKQNTEWRLKDNAYQRENYAKRSEEINRQRRQRYHNDLEYRDKVLAAGKEYNNRNKDIKAARKFKCLYGVDFNYYKQQLQKQDGKCAICRKSSLGSEKRFPMDHDHETGKPRGVLCSNCNTFLGLAGENESILSSAIEYLQLYR